MSDDIEVQNKLGVKRLFGRLPKPTKPTPLYVVLGIADGFKTGTSTYGEWEALTGQFEVRVTLPEHENSGKAFYGTQLFLPKAAHDTVAGKLRLGAEASQGELGSVQFAMEVGYKPSNTAPGGYEYTFKPVGKFSGADPLAALREETMAALPHLKDPPKPKK